MRRTQPFRTRILLALAVLAVLGVCVPTPSAGADVPDGAEPSSIRVVTIRPEDLPPGAVRPVEDWEAAAMLEAPLPAAAPTASSDDAKALAYSAACHGYGAYEWALCLWDGRDGEGYMIRFYWYDFCQAGGEWVNLSVIDWNPKGIPWDDRVDSWWNHSPGSVFFYDWIDPRWPVGGGGQWSWGNTTHDNIDEFVFFCGPPH